MLTLVAVWLSESID